MVECPVTALEQCHHKRRVLEWIHSAFTQLDRSVLAKSLQY